MRRSCERRLLPLPAVAADEHARGPGLTAEFRAVQRGGGNLRGGGVIFDFDVLVFAVVV